MIASDSRWRRGKIPRMARWLHGKGWEDKPFVEPQEPPRQDTGDDLLARMEASRREAREAAERRARQNFPWGMAQ